MTKKILLFILLLFLKLHAVSQGQAPKLLKRVNASMKKHNRKVIRLYKRDLYWFEKRELKEKHGKDIFKKQLVVYPAEIRMNFPQHRRVDTINFYSNLNRLKLSKRKGAYASYILHKDTLFATLNTTSLNNVVVISKPADADNGPTDAYFKKLYEGHRKLVGYTGIAIERIYGGYTIHLDKNGNVFILDPECWIEHFSPTCLITLEKYRDLYDTKNWKRWFDHYAH